MSSKAPDNSVPSPGVSSSMNLQTAVLVIGAGAAGLRTAIELTEAGVDCLVVGKRDHGDAHTRMAAGGINASLGSRDSADRWALHAADTMREGGYIGQPRAVELLALEAPDRIQELADWGCPFARTEDGRIDQRFFGAQSFRRTCFVGDITGEAVLSTLVDRARTVGVAYRERIMVTRILLAGGAVAGARCIDLDTGRTLHIQTRVVVLAAGGCTSLYRRGSSRADENTGDAIGLAWEAGAELQDMEMIQFHPTGMIEPEAMSGHLVTEAVRGEGGRLFNAQGERFMKRYTPEQMELAARDVVARANYTEIREGRGTPRGGVLLDISHVDPARIRERLPQIHALFREHGVDITKEPMEVAPTAHYPMGGVVVTPETGATRVPGLYAVGEAAAGVHGANRLGGNSLAETVVFGRRTGLAIAQWLQDTGERDRPNVETEPSAAAEPPRPRDGSPERDPDPAQIMARLREMMWTHAGIVRHAEGLRSGLAELEELARDIPGRHEESADTPEQPAPAEVRFAVIAAEAILRSALLRDESRGAHSREDAPESRDEWIRNIICRREADGTMTLRCEPVAPIPPAVQEALDEHHALDYHHLE